MPMRWAALPGTESVTNNVISGACGHCGAGAGCCCASAADAAKSDASATRANVLALVMELLPLRFFAMSRLRSVAIFRIARKSEKAARAAKREVVAHIRFAAGPIRCLQRTVYLM